MANVYKQNARKARIEDGVAFTSCDYADTDERGPDGMPPILYHLETVKYVRDGVRATGYRVELSEDEMLGIVADWMKLLTRNRRDANNRLTALRLRAQRSA